MNRLKQSLSGIQAPSLPSFGKAEEDADRPTPPPLPSSTLQLIQARRATTANVQSTVLVLHKTLSKQRPDARGGSATAPPARWVGEAMVEGSEELAGLAELSDSQQAYGRALFVVGELHSQLAELSTEFTDTLSNGFLTDLEHRVDEQKLMKESLKEAEKKRSAFEAVMVKADKSKKDRSEFEAEIEAAEYAYSDECDTLVRKAAQLDAAAIKDVQALEQLVEDQLAYARKYVELLEDAKASLPSTSSIGSSSRTRSSSLNVPVTRMSRSQSESSVRSPPLPSASASLFSNLGPNRTKRGTPSSPTEDEKDSEKGEGSGSNSVKNRSRSGSMLERFALGNKGKKKDAGTSATTEEGSEGVEEDGSAGSGATTPSRFAPSNLSMPTLPGLPTLGSLRKFGSPSGARFKTLGDEPERDATSPTSPTFSSSNSRPSSSSSNSRPPLFKRTQTAPASAPSPTNSSRNGSPRRVVPPLPPTLPSRNNGPVGQTFRAQWAYTPARPSLSHDSSDTDDDDDELALEQGDLVEVEKEVNSDWWIGRLVTSGRRGMFPSAYVVPHSPSPSSFDLQSRSRPATISSIAATTGSRKEGDRWTSFSTANEGGSTDDFGGSQDDHSADGHYFGGGTSTEDDSTDDEAGDEGLLGGTAAGGRTASPFRANQPLPSTSGSPLASRRTAPRPPASRSRSSTVVKAQEASPFGDDQVSFALAEGRMAR